MTRRDNGTGAPPPDRRDGHFPHRRENVSRLLLLIVLLAIAPAAVTTRWRASYETELPLPEIAPAPAPVSSPAAPSGTLTAIDAPEVGERSAIPAVHEDRRMPRPQGAAPEHRRGAIGPRWGDSGGLDDEVSVRPTPL